jgi:hypothetical protein
LFLSTSTLDACTQVMSPLKQLSMTESQPGGSDGVGRVIAGSKIYLFYLFYSIVKQLVGITLLLVIYHDGQAENQRR